MYLPTCTIQDSILRPIRRMLRDALAGQSPDHAHAIIACGRGKVLINLSRIDSMWEWSIEPVNHGAISSRDLVTGRTVALGQLAVEVASRGLMLKSKLDEVTL